MLQVYNYQNSITGAETATHVKELRAQMAADTYGELVCDREAKGISWERRAFPGVALGKLVSSCTRMRQNYISPCTKVSSEWIGFGY